RGSVLRRGRRADGSKDAATAPMVCRIGGKLSNMRAFNAAFYRLLQHVITVLMGLLIVPVTLQVVSRYTILIPRYIWTEEVARFCFVWIIMVGAMIAVRDGTHFDVDVLPRPKT